MTDFHGALEGAVLVLEARLIERVADGDEHALAGERLLDEIKGAELRRFDRRAHGAVARDDHDRQRVVGLADLLQRFEAVHAGHFDVEKDQVGGFALDDRERFGSARSLLDVVAFVFENHPHRPADLRLVVDDQNASFHPRARGFAPPPPPALSRSPGAPAPRLARSITRPATGRSISLRTLAGASVRSALSAEAAKRRTRIAWLTRCRSLAFIETRPPSRSRRRAAGATDRSRRRPGRHPSARPKRSSGNRRPIGSAGG